MKICFSKHGNIINELDLLETSWKENCVELIWDIHGFSINQKCLLISQFGFQKITRQKNNLELIILPNIKNPLLKKIFNRGFYQISLFNVLRKSEITHFVPADSRGFGLFLIFLKLLKIKIIPNLSRQDHLKIKYLILYKIFKIKTFIVPGYYYKKQLVKKGIGSEQTIKVRQPHYPKSFTYFEKLPYFENNTFKVLFTSRLIKAKGIFEFLDAAISVVNNHKHIHFYIAGIGDEYKTIKKKIDENHLEKRIHLLGNFTNLEIGNLMLNSDLLVFPSHTEGFAKTWIESIITETPTILTPLPAITDILKDGINSIYIEVNNSYEIQEKIILLSQSPQILKDIKKELIKTKEILVKQSDGNFKECIEQLIYENENC